MWAALRTLLLTMETLALTDLAQKISRGRELNAAYVMTKNEALNYKLRLKVYPKAIILPALMEPYLIAY